MTTPSSIDSPEFWELLYIFEGDPRGSTVDPLVAFINAHTEKVRQEQIKKDAALCETVPIQTYAIASYQLQTKVARETIKEAIRSQK